MKPYSKDKLNAANDLTASSSLVRPQRKLRHRKTRVLNFLSTTDESFNQGTSFNISINRNSKSNGVTKKSIKIRKRKSISGDKCPTDAKKVKASLFANRLGDCPICWDQLGKNPMVSTKCGHVYCFECLEKVLKIEKKCPTCRRSLKRKTDYHPLYL